MWSGRPSLNTSLADRLETIRKGPTKTVYNCDLSGTDSVPSPLVGRTYKIAGFRRFSPDPKRTRRNQFEEGLFLFLGRSRLGDE